MSFRGCKSLRRQQGKEQSKNGLRFSPIRSELAERLPEAETIIEKMGMVDVQYKYDGFRTQIHKDGQHVSIFSRNLEDMSAMFPKLVATTRTHVQAESAILDAEALAYNLASD